MEGTTAGAGDCTGGDGGPWGSWSRGREVQSSGGLTCGCLSPTRLVWPDAGVPGDPLTEGAAASARTSWRPPAVLEDGQGGVLTRWRGQARQVHRLPPAQGLQDSIKALGEGRSGEEATAGS